MTFDVEAIRAQFPALHQAAPDGTLPIFFDNPAGTQVPQSVIDAYTMYYTQMNANAGGAFHTSQLNDKMTADTRQAVADFINAPRPEEVAFGPNMTTLCFSLSRALSKTLPPDAEIILTRMDHDANVSPWLTIADDLGLTVRWVDLVAQDATLDLDSLEAALTERTKIVATVHASNAVGTINPVPRIAQMAHAAGAYHVVDAVQSAPHLPLDVQALGMDFLLCSSYKFFGPHAGVMWGKYDLLAELPAYKVRPAKDQPPYRWESGTPAFESLAGVGAAVRYLGKIGATYGAPYRNDFDGYTGDRLNYKTGMKTIQHYEQTLVTHLLDVLQRIPGVTVYGITDPARYDERCPTVVFTHEHYTPDQIAAHLAEHHIYVWSGHYYAIEIMETLGHPQHGMLRVGLAHYNTITEIDRMGAILTAFLA